MATIQMIVASLTLLAFIVSIFVLWKTMRAAELQSEGTAKPVLTLMRKKSEPSDEDFLEPQIHVEVAVPFKVRNVGTGPALMVQWKFRRDSGDELACGMIPYIRTEQWVNTHLSVNQTGAYRRCDSREFGV
ncbi:MAG TPA: hypothetical protein VMT20_22975 [Terriglobia bacterium]|nr:hypothetical protein [Terriglobia bacterium]